MAMFRKLKAWQLIGKQTQKKLHTMAGVLMPL
jgi:hypothetical protein